MRHKNAILEDSHTIPDEIECCVIVIVHEPQVQRSSIADLVICVVQTPEI